jgi:3-methyladenine DNA glycosylase AlkC
MGFYDLTKEQRAEMVRQIKDASAEAFRKNRISTLEKFFSDDDTYIRKAAYQAVGKIYNEHVSLRASIITMLLKLFKKPFYAVRQTAVNAAGEIGMKAFSVVESIFDQGLFDEHHTVRNAVIGSIKKMGERNPKPVLNWAKKYLHHPDKEVRREICHGIELRGRTHPQDILPLLKALEHDKTTRVSNTLIHVLGQISYKKGCLETVMAHLNTWSNKELVAKAVEEIIDVHERYKNFAVLTQKQAIAYIDKNFNH